MPFRSMHPVVVLVCLFIYSMSAVGSPAAAEDGSQGTIEVLGSMSTPRYNHTATVISDGSVLVCGGTSDGSASLRSAEIMGPGEREWRTVGEMIVPRMRHAATPLPDGKVIITGGFLGKGHPSLFKHFNGTGNESLASCEFYDPESGSFSSAPSMGQGRFWHAALALKDGRTMVIGGVNATEGALSTCEIFDPALDRWTRANGMRTPRVRFAYGLLEDGRVVVAGGHDGKAKVPMASCEIFDPAFDLWTDGPPLSDARGYPAFTMLPTGELLVSGGFRSPTGPDLSSTEVLDALAMGWTLGPNMSFGRHGHVAVNCGKGNVLAFGGSDWETGACLSSVELFESDGSEWQDPFVTVEGRIWGQGADLGGGKVILMGGKACTSPSGRTELFVLREVPIGGGDEGQGNSMLFALVLLCGASVLVLAITFRKRRRGTSD